MANKLTAKMEMFCQEYLVDLNATQAAIRAGYSEKTAQEISSENLSKPIIQKRIQELQSKRAEKLGITQDRVLQEIARLSFVDIRKLYTEDGRLKNIQDLDDDTAAAINSIEAVVLSRDEGQTTQETVKKYKLVDKKGSLDMLARHMGMYNADDSGKSKTTVKIVDMTGKKDTQE